MMFTTLLFALLVAVIGAAPVPEVASTVVDGLTTCAKPVINNMVMRAINFGCPPHPDGTPNLVCLCRSKPFKTRAKHGISSVCPNHEQTSDARRWAIGLCTAALTKASKGRGVSRTVESPFGHHIVSSKPAAMVSGGKNSTAPLPFAVFDIDDDEDETAGAAAAEPAALVSLVVALGVAFFLL